MHGWLVLCQNWSAQHEDEAGYEGQDLDTSGIWPGGMYALLILSLITSTSTQQYSLTSHLALTYAQHTQGHTTLYHCLEAPTNYCCCAGMPVNTLNNLQYDWHFALSVIFLNLNMSFQLRGYFVSFSMSFQLGGVLLNLNMSFQLRGYFVNLNISFQLGGDFVNLNMSFQLRGYFVNFKNIFPTWRLLC